MSPEGWWESLADESGEAPEPDRGDHQKAVGRAPRNRLTRWAALSAAADRYRDGQVTAEVAAKQAAVPLEEFEQFLQEWRPRDSRSP